MVRTVKGPKPAPKRKKPSSGGSKGTAKQNLEEGSEANKKQKQSDNSTNKSTLSKGIPVTVDVSRKGPQLLYLTMVQK